MGGKSQDNSAMINEQKAQAEEARQKEAARQSRINQGLANITAAFKGGPIMGSTTSAPTTWSGTGAVPAGYTKVATPSTNASSGGGVGGYVGGKDATQPQTTQKVKASGGGGHDYGIQYETVPANTVNNSSFAIRGPDGKIIQPGQSYGGGDVVSYDTGQRSGGFDDAFYNEYRQGMLDYFTPQVQDQYGEAKDEATYRLARAGTLNSSAAADVTADLAKQNTLNLADVQSKADAGAAELRSRVASEQAKAESQLYATEDPDVATNQALAAVKNISLAEPELTPLGEIFKVAAIGGANAVSGYRSQNLINQIPDPYKKQTTSVVNG